MVDLLHPDDFYSKQNALIFEAMASLHNDGKPVDEVTTAGQLTAVLGKQTGHISYIATLAERVPTSANVLHYAELVRQRSAARRAIRIINDARDAAMSNNVAEAMAKLSRLDDAGLWPHLGALEGRQTSLASWPALNELAMHGLAGDYVRAVSPHTEADPVAILVQLLVAFGNIVGRGPHFVAEADRHYTNEFVVLVGSTAKGRKGSSWGHVRKLCEGIDAEWVKKRVRSGLASGEGLVHAVRDPSSSSNDDDTRLLALEGEFASALAVAAREGNTLSAVVRSAWDGIPLGNMTKNNPD